MSICELIAINSFETVTATLDHTLAGNFVGRQNCNVLTEFNSLASNKWSLIYMYFPMLLILIKARGTQKRNKEANNTLKLQCSIIQDFMQS